jgi:predicted nucleotidyltransferase
MEKVISQEKMDQYRQSAKEKERRQRGYFELRHQQGVALAHKAANVLKKQFGASKVVLFGSFLDPSKLHYRSDIDLAAWEIEEKDLFYAVSILLSLDPEFEIDLVLFENARPAIQASIEKEGIVL